MLLSMGSQRAGHDLVTEQQQQERRYDNKHQGGILHSVLEQTSENLRNSVNQMVAMLIPSF